MRMQAVERLESMDIGGAVNGWWVCWIPPPQEVIKANFDAAVWEDGKATLACVVRNYTSSILLVDGWLCESLDIFEAETRAAWESVRLLRSCLQNQWVWVEGDSLAVVQGLKTESCQLGTSTLLEDARRLLQNMKVHDISHTYREGNHCTDQVMKWVRELNTNVTLRNGFPSMLQNYAQGDALGICYERMQGCGLGPLISQKRKEKKNLRKISSLKSPRSMPHSTRDQSITRRII